MNKEVDFILKDAELLSPCPSCSYEIGLLRHAMLENDAKKEKEIKNRTNLGVIGANMAKGIGIFIRRVPEENMKWWNDSKFRNMQVSWRLQYAYELTHDAAIGSMVKLAKFRATNNPKEHVAFVKLMNFYFRYINKTPYGKEEKK